MLTVSLLLSGCGAEETSGNVESSQVEAEQESAEQVEKEIEGASFTWNVSDKDLYLLMRRQLEVKPSWFLGTATYADGTTGSIEADRIDLGRDGLILLVDVYYDGGESVRYQIEVPEMWEDMNLNEQSQEDVEAWYEGLGGDSSQVDESTMSGSVNEIKENPWDGLYSVKDAPGLTNIDWDAFNGYMYAEQVSFLGDDKLEINVLQVLGSDPRINNDWSELNDKFSALYGNDDEGLAKFANDLARSYDYSVDFARGFCDYAYLDIEPYRTNTDNGVYGEIVELEITNQAAYDAWYEEQHPEKPEEVLTPEEQVQKDYETEMSTHWMTISNLSMDLYSKGIYTMEISNTFQSEYDLLDWLITNGHLSDPDGKYRESVTWYINNK